MNALPTENSKASLKIAICPTFIMEPQKNALVSMIDNHLGLSSDIRIADMDTIESELFNPHSETFSFNPDAIIVLWRFEDIAPDLVFKSGSMSEQGRQNVHSELEGRITALIENYNGKAPIFLSTLPMPYTMKMPFGIQSGPIEILYRLNAHIHSLTAEKESVFLFDFARWAAQEGGHYNNEKYELYAKQGISPQSLKDFGRFIAQSIRPLQKASKKVLALDLDNTLWGGVLGEDLVSGVAIGQEFPGNIYYRIQQLAKFYKDQGVILVLMTKNNEADVKEAFDTLSGQMPLKYEDFSLVKSNWEPKSKNICDSLQELNLGIDSVVFLDDSTFECEQVRQACPEVTVLEHKGDPLSMLEALRSYSGFDQLSVQKEDTLRAQDYVNSNKRKQLEGAAGNYEDFINSLELKAILQNVDKKSIGRSVQMLSKTNQFNVTTRRHDLAALNELNASDENTLITLSLSDKFGDQGIVGLAIALKKEEGVAEIDTFMLSCRALGRGAENVLWVSLLKALQTKGYKTVNAMYIPTQKNSQCQDLFKKFGMHEMNVAKDGTKTYELCIQNKEFEYSHLINIEDYVSKNG